MTVDGDSAMASFLHSEDKPGPPYTHTFTLPGPAGHIEQHFAPDGLCQCPCDECTLRLIRSCVCDDCPCEDDSDHGGE